MGYVLAEVGFRVRRLAARVIWMLPPDAAAVVDTLSDRFGINTSDAGERGTIEARIDKILND